MLNMKNTTLISGMVENLEFVDVFDTVILINVIEHVSDLFLFLSRIYFSLKPGGLLIFHERWHDDAEASNCALGSFELHPIRVKKEVLDHFLSLFESEVDALYYEIVIDDYDFFSSTNLLCKDYIGTSYYVAARKKS